jgi:DNA invertase Pin-like site-specific DNA recombinase
MAHLIPAAQYLRMSTERQQYSTTHQQHAIAEYAMLKGFEVIRTYVDEARSGLGIKHRAGLQQLFKDVLGGNAPFKLILVYDVSRWGRFLDTDESAHYEFLCKSAGIPVHYCAESFGHDPTLPNMILKAIKRTMAGEYSRELSAKVFRGLDRIVRCGFRSGGVPGYGLRRLLVAADGSRKVELRMFERKSLQSDRVIYVLGPDNEVKCVRDIYRMFIEERMSYADITRRLNEMCVPVHLKNGTWTHHAVRTILSHPKYTGSLVYNRTTRRLQSPCRNVPEDEWIVVPNAFEAIIDQATYRRAELIRNNKVSRKTDSQLLGELRAVLRQVGKLSTTILSNRSDAPSARACRERFSSLTKAYALIGYRADVMPAVELRGRLQSLRRALMERLVAMYSKELSIVGRGLRWRACLRHKAGFKISVRACRSVMLPTKGRRWVIEPFRKENGFITLLALLNASNTEFETLLLVPGIASRGKVTVGPKDSLVQTGVALTDLWHFGSCIERVRASRKATTVPRQHLNVKAQGGR